MPAMTSDTAFNRVYRGNQSNTGKYFTTVKRDFRSEIDGHSSSLILASRRYEKLTRIRREITPLSRLRDRERVPPNLSALPRQLHVILSSPRAFVSKSSP